MKTVEQVEKDLNNKIPREAVQEREAFRGGPTLSYVSSFYVIDRLNQIFGNGGWSKEVVSVSKLFDGEVNGKPYVSYTAKVRLGVRNGKFSKVTEDYGFGDGRDTNPGKAHELAIKEAVTDALKRCAKDLGMSLGLALYDKTQEYVQDAETCKEPDTNATAIESSIKASKTTNKKTKNTENTTNTVTQDIEAIKAVIRSAALVLDSKKTLSRQDFIEQYLKGKYNVDKVNALTDTQANELLNTLKTTYTELRLN